MADFAEEFVLLYVEMQGEKLLDIYKNSESGVQTNQSNYENLNLRIFDCIEYKSHESEHEIHSENHFYNNINNCECYTDELFNR